MDWPYLLDSFEGRIGRKTFWIAMLAVGIANALGCYLADQIGGIKLSAIVDLAFTYPEFAVAAKRSQDRDLPIWLLISFFAANAGLDLLDVQGWSGTSGHPSVPAILIALPFTVLFLILMVELGFRRGTPGANQHGPDPLAKS